ncbi:MAG: methyltransferase [Janthinobacterium lividum]
MTVPDQGSADAALVNWEEGGKPLHARWRSESGTPVPKMLLIADDRMTADAAWRLVSEGSFLLWRGDYQNGRQLLQAMGRRASQRAARPDKRGSDLAKAPPTALQAFNLHRQSQSQRARLLGMLLLQFDPGHLLSLRRAPDVRQQCQQAYGPAGEPYVVSMRELLGLIGAYEWRKTGVEIAALGARIHPHYGVFSPLRGEYITLVDQAVLPAHDLAFDIGTGTGVLAAVLAKRGVARIVATDQDSRALACAHENLQQLGLAGQVELLQVDLFPPGHAPLVVCNPPWLPARPSSPIEYAIYDPDSRMLRGFLAGLADHLTPQGEGWLILSDLAEHLGLRSREQLLAMFAESGLTVAGRSDIRPRHGKASDASDPLFAARSAEITSLWRLVAA